MSLASGLAHLWPLNEDSGSEIADVVGGLGAGSVVGDTGGDTIISGALGFGSARNLEATSPFSYLDLYTGASDGGAYELTEWTLTLRFMRNGAPANQYPCLWMCGSNAIVSNRIASYLDFETGALGVDAVTATGGGIGLWGAATGSLADGNWHRVTLTFDGATLALYQDGSLIDSAAVSGAIKIFPKNAPLEIGRYDSTNCAAGAFDDIAIYNRALTTAEIESSEFLSQPLPIPEPFATGPLSSQYSYLDVDDGVLSPLRIPISSWQATLQADRSSFVQAVIPGALDWVDQITARQTTGEIIITHAVRDIDGSEQAWEVVRAPLQQINFDRGPQRATARVSSYATPGGGSAGTTVTLQNVRSISISSGGVRMRCDLDPTIKPGNTAVSGSTSFVVAYINHYANDSDRYMDVGERAL